MFFKKTQPQVEAYTEALATSQKDRSRIKKRYQQQQKRLNDLIDDLMREKDAKR